MKNSLASDCFGDKQQTVAFGVASAVEEKSVTLLEKANIYMLENPEEWAKRKQAKKVYADRKVKIYKVHPTILQMHTLRDLRINEKHKEWKENNNKQVSFFYKKKY